MYAQGPSDPGGAYDFLHKVRIFGLQLRELIYDHNEMGHGLADFAAFVKFYVIVDVVYTAF